MSIKYAEELEEVLLDSIMENKKDTLVNRASEGLGSLQKLADVTGLSYRTLLRLNYPEPERPKASRSTEVMLRLLSAMSIRYKKDILRRALGVEV